MYPTRLFAAWLMLLLVSGLFFGCEEKTQEITYATKSPEALQLFLEGLEKYDFFYHDQARKLFEKATIADPDFAMAWYYWALTATNSADYQKRLRKAIELAEQASEPEWLIIMSSKARNQDNAALARHHLEQLVNLLPRSKRAHMTLGVFYYGHQEWDLAEKEFRATVEVAPDFAPAYNMLGYLLSNRGKYSEAIKALKKYAALRPQDPNPHDSMGEIYLWMGDHKNSIREFSKSLELDPHFVVSRAGIGHNHLFRGEFDQARTRYQEMLQYAVSVADTSMGLFWRAVSYLHQNRYDKAIATLKEQLEFARAHNDLYTQATVVGQMGIVYREKGDFGRALKATKQVREIAARPEIETGAREEYLRACAFTEAIVSARQGRREQANSHIDEFRVSAEAAGNPLLIKALHGLLGVVAYWSEDYQTAVRELQKGNPQDQYTKYYLALSYEKSGQHDKAKEIFSEVAKYNRNSLFYALVRPAAMGKL